MTDAQNKQIKYLITSLNDARRQYYTDTNEELKMTDLEYDKMLKKLKELEELTGEYLPNTPTKSVGFSPSCSNRVAHCKPILSLKDTKNIDELMLFIGQHEGVISWKLDGISIILHYVNGHLIKALTRGDGLIGLDITDNVVKMRHVPLQISSRGSLFVRGEGCLSIKEFEQIRKTKEGDRYVNPRSAAAGIINTSTSPSILLKHMNFVAHSIVLFDEKSKNIKTYNDQLSYLNNLGFNVVYHEKVLNFELKYKIGEFTEQVPNYEFPVDGLVLALNNLEYGVSLGSTAKYPKHSMAFKWPDEHRLTKVIGMKWSVSGSGLITPVVLFKPILLEGTTVKQANLHNLKFFEGLSIGKGDILRVYKANKIVPEVEENMTRSGTELYPNICPVCGGKTTVVETNKTRKLYCYACAK